MRDENRELSMDHSPGGSLSVETLTVASAGANRLGCTMSADRACNPFRSVVPQSLQELINQPPSHPPVFDRSHATVAVHHQRTCLSYRNPKPEDGQLDLPRIVSGILDHWRKLCLYDCYAPLLAAAVARWDVDCRRFHLLGHQQNLDYRFPASKNSLLQVELHRFCLVCEATGSIGSIQNQNRNLEALKPCFHARAAEHSPDAPHRQRN